MPVSLSLSLRVCHWALALLLFGCGARTPLEPLPDSGSDGAVSDGGRDAGRDAGPDGGRDAGPDGGFDAGRDAGPECVSDEECFDELLCNGNERCVGGRCREGVPVDCVPPPDGCTLGRCDEGLGGECVFEPQDRDEDGHLPVDCGGDDCDDEEPTVFGGAPELCDRTDNDCDGEVDEGLVYGGLGSALDVSSGTMGAVQPDVAFAGGGFNVVFDSDGSTGQVFHSAVQRNGRRASRPSAVTFSEVLASSPDLVWNGSEYGLWHHFHLDEAFQGTVSLTRLADDGAVIRRARAATADVPDADDPAAAWSGTDWGVAYLANLTDGRREIRFLRASADGTRVTVAPWTLAAGFDVPVAKPSIAWTGRRFVIAWGQGRTTHIVGLEPAGGRVAWRERQAAVGQPQTTMSWTVEELMVAWSSTTGVDGVHLARFRDNGSQRGRTIDLTSDLADRTGVSSVWTGEELGVTYQQTRSSEQGTFLVRVAERASWRSLPGRVDDRVSPGAGTAAAWSGSAYGIVYGSDRPRGGAVFFRLAACE